MFYPFLKKGSQNAPYNKGKIFQETQYFDHDHLSYFFTKICGFSFFGHPVWLKYSFNGLAYPLLKKDTQNAQLQKGKTFQETQYFDHVHISHFFHQNMSIFIFWTPCMARIAFHWLGLSILE